MSEATLETKGLPLLPGGMNDNTPLQSAPDFYETRGIHSISERCLQRMEGKQLITKFNAPVLAIHGNLRNFLWVETSTALYLITP